MRSLGRVPTELIMSLLTWENLTRNVKLPKFEFEGIPVSFTKDILGVSIVYSS